MKEPYFEKYISRREGCKDVHLTIMREHHNQEDSNIIKRITKVHRAIVFSMHSNEVAKFPRVRNFVA